VVHAGWPRPGPALPDATDDELLTVWRQVVVAAFTLTQAALPRLVSRRYGRVVLVADGAGLLYGHDELAAHDMAMGGVTAMMRTLAAEALADGVATNAVLAVPDIAETAAGPAPDPTVIAAATWLASSRCDVSGRFFAAGQARMAEVFSCAGRGYQSADPARFSIEEVRDHWPAALSLDGSIAPANQVEYNAFRTAVYQATVR
jgi:NAD(P)-dependent dehydrogenase (short-subunit alcohol dehydrogenase family)